MLANTFWPVKALSIQMRLPSWREIYYHSRLGGRMFSAFNKRIIVVVCFEKESDRFHHISADISSTAFDVPFKTDARHAKRIHLKKCYSESCMPWVLSLANNAILTWLLEWEQFLQTLRHLDGINEAATTEQAQQKTLIKIVFYVGHDVRSAMTRCRITNKNAVIQNCGKQHSYGVWMNWSRMCRRINHKYTSAQKKNVLGVQCSAQFRRIGVVAFCAHEANKMKISNWVKKMP